MVKKSRAFSQDLAQEHQNRLLKKTKNLVFRGPPHRTVPSSNKNVQEPDLEAKEDNIPARPKTEGKDAVASSSGRNLTFVTPPSPVPSIVEEPFPLVSTKRHSKATPACPGQADDAPRKRTSKVYSILDSAETGPESSSESAHEEYSASTQEFGPLWAIKVVGAPWMRTPKVCPALLPECNPSSEPSFNWAQGASPSCPTEGVSAPREKITKASLDLKIESQTSPRVLSKPSFSWVQGEGPPPQAASPASATKGFSGARKRIPKASLACPTQSKASPRLLSKSSLDWTQEKSPQSQEASPVCINEEVRAPRKRTNKIYPALPTESQPSPRILLEPSFNWAQGEGGPPQEVTPACPFKGLNAVKKRINRISLAMPKESKISPEIRSEPSFNWVKGKGPSPQEASPTCGIKEFSAAPETTPTVLSKTLKDPPPQEGSPACTTPRETTTNVSPALPMELKTSPRVPYEPSFNWAQGEEGPSAQEAVPACGRLWKRTGKFLPALIPKSNPSPTRIPENSSQKTEERGQRHQGLLGCFFKCFRK